VAEDSEPGAKAGSFRDSMPSVMHPRGLIAPPLGPEAPLWRRGLRSVYRVGQGLYFHDALDTAPAMAFHVFLSLLPLLVFLGYVVGNLAQKRGIETVLWPVLDSLPKQAEQVVRKEVERLADASTLGPLAALGFLWIASGGMHGCMNALETVIGAPRRPFWKKRLLAIGWVVASMILLTSLSVGVVKWDELSHPPATAEVSPAPTSAPARVQRIERRLKLLRSEGERALTLGFGLTGSVAALAAFYWFSVSHPRRVKRRVLPGAVFAVALWILISWAFGLYVRSLTDYAVFYGSLAAVAVLLVWLWLVCLAVLVGAELNAQLEGLRD
jgi:membrane protein